MDSNKLKKMLEAAGKDLKAAQEKYAEIERRLKTSSYRNYALILSPVSWKDAERTIKKICFESKTAHDALQAILNLNLRHCTQVSISALQVKARNHDLFIGDMVFLPYEDSSKDIDTLVPFKVCRADGGAALLDCAFTLDSVKFSADESNKYANSDIRKHLATLENRFDPELVGIIMPREVKYIDTSVCEYKTVTDKFWLLDLDEALTFYKTMDNRRKFMAYGSSVGSADYWWLRSAYAGSANYAGFVYTDGYVDYNRASYSYGCSPAFLIG